ncbi:MAG: electron transport complex subunit RsxC [Eubacterium sp.]|nr:electron transport complex subunit RsxC [Eubacterium sp.]
MSQQRKHLHSIHVAHHKNTDKCETVVMPVPSEVCIPMSMHIGAPCKPLVAKGDTVKVGQLIGDTDAFVSAPIHSSVSGTVKAIEEQRNAMGGYDQVIVIETDGKQEVAEGIEPPKAETREEFVAAIRKSGLVGLGGASFPTHIKFNPQNLDEVETLIVNAAECEPYITSDHRLMVEDTQDIIDGMKLVMKHLELKKGYIGVEGNKPDAIEKLKATIAEQGLADSMEVVTLQTTYPQGAERVMVYEITGKHMAAGVLPASLGIILSNVTSIAFVGKYFRTGMPLVEKRMTIDGSAVTNPGNIIAPLGTRIADIMEFCGGYKAEPKKILMGGPMMGRAVFSDALPVVKNNNAILAFSGPQALVPEETNCINCGRCHNACPFNLLPTALSEAVEAKDAERLDQLQVMQCMECGSCAYVCPARRPLGFNNKLGKAILKEAQSK